MKSGDAKKKKDYHSKRYNYYLKKEKQAKILENGIGFKLSKDQ